MQIQDEGVLAKRLVPAQGAELKVGEPIALIVDDLAAYKEFLAMGPNAALAAQKVAPAAAAASSSSAAATTQTNSSSTKSLGPKRLSPAARHIAENNRVDVTRITATAFGGEIISKGDVLNAIKSGNVNATAVKSHNSQVSQQADAAAPANVATKYPSAPSPVPLEDLSVPVNNRYKDIPNNNMRKIIAKRLTESKATVPHMYASTEIEIDSLLAMRKTLKKDMDINVSVNDVVIKAAALALRDMPEVNSKWSTKSQTIEESSTVDISVAVATPNGLITPIVKGADRRGLVNISQVITCMLVNDFFSIAVLATYRRLLKIWRAELKMVN
jgi:pyruvate dehydrogenase E2 component (dihydrolipoamide acetyltransferase)